jgi:hypothetical protein
LEKSISFLFKKYRLGGIGLIYFAISMLVTIQAGNFGLLSTLTKSLQSLKREDKYVDLYLAHEDVVLEVNSRSLHRYEDLLIIAIIIAAIKWSGEGVNDALEAMSKLIQNLVDIVVTSNNISLLFDAAVQLKRLSITHTLQEHCKTTCGGFLEATNGTWNLSRGPC